MNKTRIIVAIGVAVILALIASVGAYKFLSERGRQAEQARLQTAGVVVAVVDIPVASTINTNQVALMPWPKGNLPKDAVSDPKKVAGRAARREFVSGEPIVESKLVPADKVPGILSLKVPVGMRAFTLQVNEVVGVGGFIIPDTRVDVVLTTSSASQGGQQVSKIVLQDIKVLAAGQTLEQKDNKPITVNTVTVAVMPEDAEKLALAVNDGKILLVLRSFMDNAVVTTTGVDKARLLASNRSGAPVAAEKEAVTPKRGTKIKSPQPPQPPVVMKKRHEVEVIKGNKRSVEKFE
jgi:pilus assembly protein CpaB